ncbi:hypothetical protein E8E14_005807 [Neopestalotiopsis sp. 37M]|nr:hypothetical protein E8E14_005807 [Neopestalotiopsis sp. 37M]
MATTGELSPPPSYGADTLISPTESQAEKISVHTTERPSSTTPESQKECVKKAPLVIDDGGLPEVFTPEQKVAIGADGPQPVVLPASPVHSTTPRLDGFDTVTPLNLLGDQSDVVDCPFCRRRVETRVEKKPSTATHVGAGALFLTTLGGVVLPYKKHWRHHVHHHCGNCDRLVAHRRYDEKEMQPLGTPDHLRVKSLYPPSETSVQK